MKAILLATVLAAAPAFGQTVPAFDSSALIESAIKQVKAMAWRRDKVDWPILEARARAEAAKARDGVDILSAYEMLLDGLGDNHSFVNVSADRRAAFKARHGHEFDSGRVHKASLSKLYTRRSPDGIRHAIGKLYALRVLIPFVTGGGAPASAYADKLYGHFVANSAACGYIVDIRGNAGGNGWAMVTGLTALLGDGFGTPAPGAPESAMPFARIAGGKAIVNYGAYKDTAMFELAAWKPLPALAQAPVAVLIDDIVGSSGEMTAIAFKGRSATRFFGQQSYGVASENEGFVLPDDTNIVVTTGMMRDRGGRTYPEGVPVDVTVMPGEGSAKDPDDAVVEAAKAWLGKQRACR
ncbi:MAG: hypothetical protein EOP62_10425 [Sphingomonadales bacterium]|nr:MAG: hypothetical protein EOP62_10425 [Sphingomonadales bacterium]